MKRIALIACSASKRSSTSCARDLYTGDLFRKSRAYADATCDGMAVLSAKHGLLAADALVEPYNERLSSRKAELAKWTARVIEQLRASYDLSETTFVLLAGRQYREGLEACDELLTEWPFPAVRGLGDMKAWLAQQVKETA